MLFDYVIPAYGITLAIALVSLVFLELLWFYPMRKKFRCFRTFGATVSEIIEGAKIPDMYRLGGWYAFPIYSDRQSVLQEFVSDEPAKNIFNHLAKGLAHQLDAKGLDNVKIHLAMGRPVVKYGSGDDWKLGRAEPVLVLSYYDGNVVHLILDLDRVGNQQILSCETYCHQGGFSKWSDYLFAFVPALNLFYAVLVFVQVYYLIVDAWTGNYRNVAGENSGVLFDFSFEGSESLEQVANVMLAETVEYVTTL